MVWGRERGPSDSEQRRTQRAAQDETSAGEESLSTTQGEHASPAPPTTRSPIIGSVDLDGFGKSVGSFALPWSRDESGWGNLLTPIAVIANGDGPTVLLTGGNHGDEFEGPVALRRIVHDLDPSMVQGRVIVVPGLNHAALCAGTRLSPIDGGNLNRSFPGDRAGTTTERVADFVYRELVGRADIVVDIHSGGRSMVFEPFVATHDLDDADQAERTMGYLEAFGTDLGVIVAEPDPVGLLDSAVEELGKVFLTTEIWGGATVSARTASIAERGVRNTLRHAGVLGGQPDVDRDEPMRFVRMVDDGSVLSPTAGLFEPLVDPGDPVDTDTPVARVHDLDDLSAPSTVLTTAIAGRVVMRHAPALIRAGDPAVAVAVPAVTPRATPDRSNPPPTPGGIPT